MRGNTSCDAHPSADGCTNPHRSADYGADGCANGGPHCYPNQRADWNGLSR